MDESKNRFFFFFQIAGGEMWFLGHDWKPSLGICFSVGAQVLRVREWGQGLAVPYTPPPQSCWAHLLPWLEIVAVPVSSSPWNAQTATAAFPLQQQNPTELLGKEGRARHRNHLQFVLSIFYNTARVEYNPWVITENAHKLCFQNSKLRLEGDCSI